MNDFYGESLRWLWAPVSTIISALLGWMFWSLKRVMVPIEEWKQHKKHFEGEMRRLDKVEAGLVHLPTRDHLHDLSIQLARLEEQHDALKRAFRVQLKPVVKAVSRIEAILLEEKA